MNEKFDIIAGKIDRIVQSQEEQVSQITKLVRLLADVPRHTRAPLATNLGLFVRWGMKRRDEIVIRQDERLDETLEGYC